MKKKFISPFSWPGSKRQIAEAVWSKFGTVDHYIEPFFGTGAVLFGRPVPSGLETVNDKDGFIVNFWRAVQYSPLEVVRWCVNPSFESDLHARHYWLASKRKYLTSMLEGDPYYYDEQIAGWWLWGMSQWYGSGFCGGDGPWYVNKENQLVRSDDRCSFSETGVRRKRISLTESQKGILSVKNFSSAPALMTTFSERIKDVRVTSGDWASVCSTSVITSKRVTGIFFDPPYGFESGRYSKNIYNYDSLKTAAKVREFCVAHSANSKLRIALCGYDDEHTELEDLGWRAYGWSSSGGYANFNKKRTNDNRHREVVWFSPGCLAVH